MYKAGNTFIIRFSRIILVECKWGGGVKSLFTLEVLQNAFTKATFLRNLIPICDEDPRIKRDLKADVNSEDAALSSIILCMVLFITIKISKYI